MKPLPDNWRTALSQDLASLRLKIVKEKKLLTVQERKRIAQIEKSMKQFKCKGRLTE